MDNIVSRCKKSPSCNLHAAVQSLSYLPRTDAGVTLLELLAAIVLSVSILTTIGLVYRSESTSWNTAVSSEQLQSDLDTVNAGLTTVFQNMNQARILSGDKEIKGSNASGTLWDISVAGQDIVITKIGSSGSKTSKTFHFTGVSLSNTAFSPGTSTASGNGTGTATKLVDAKLAAQLTETHTTTTQMKQSELDVKYAVGSGF